MVKSPLCSLPCGLLNHIPGLREHSRPVEYPPSLQALGQPERLLYFLMTWGAVLTENHQFLFLLMVAGCLVFSLQLPVMETNIGFLSPIPRVPNLDSSENLGSPEATNIEELKTVIGEWLRTRKGP